MIDHNTKTVTRFKPGKVTRQELKELARDIGPDWKKVGRALDLEDPDLSLIDADERGLYEKSYGMLRKWTQINALSGTYEQLGRALMRPEIGRHDLAHKYCEKPQDVSDFENNSVITRFQGMIKLCVKPKRLIHFSLNLFLFRELLCVLPEA